MQIKHKFNSFDLLVRVDKYVSGVFSSTLATYYYDANGARAKTVEGSSTNVYVY
jgi:hypothetical protein